MARDRSTAFLRELHRRHVWRTLGIYVGGGWALLQVVDLFIERGFVPEWVFTGALVALGLVLPVVVGTSWVQGGGSEWSDDDEAAPEWLGVLTWKRAVAGGVLAFAFLGLLTTAYMAMRVLGIGAPATLAARGVFEEGGRLVLSDFVSTAGEAAPGDLVTEALRIDLAQSSAFELVDPAAVRATLALMRRDGSEPLTEEVAREVAVRGGAQAVVSGEVGRLGTGFSITARVVAAESGAVLAPFRVTADSEDELVDAIDELSDDMRSKIGESLRSVAQSESLPAVTTTSLEALRKYTTVANRLDRGLISPPAAQQLLLEAVRLDSTFASAHRALAIAIANYGGDRETAAWAATSAYEQRDRLPERERLATEAYYHSAVSGDQSAAARAYRSMLERDSTDYAAAINLADNEMYAGDYEEAVRTLRRLPRWDLAPWTFNLTAALSGAGDLEGALAVRDTTELRSPNDPYLVPVRSLVLSQFGLPDASRSLLDGAVAPAGLPGATFRQNSAIIHILSGRLDAAASELSAAVADAGEHGTRSIQLSVGLTGPLATAWSGLDPDGAERELDALLADIDWPSMTPFNRDEPMVALVLAMIGKVERARVLLDGYDAQALPYPDPMATATSAIARALAEIQTRGDAALPALQEAVELYRCARCRDLLLGYGYELTDRRAEAIEAYERYLRHPFFDGADPLTHIFVAVVHERLGTLYESVEDPVRAAEHYAAFADLWAAADADLQPRTQGALARVRMLTADPG